MKAHMTICRACAIFSLLCLLLCLLQCPRPRAAEEQGHRTWVKDVGRLIVEERFADAEKEIDRKKSDSAAMNDPLYRASCSLLTGFLNAQKKDGRPPLPFYKEAFELFSKADDIWGKAVTELRWGTYAIDQGDRESAEKMLSDCAPVLEKEHEYKLAAISYIQLFTLYKSKNDDQRVDSAIEMAVKNFSGDGDMLRAGVSYSQWGHYYFMQGKYEKALQYNKKALELLEKTEHRDFQARFLILEANTLSALGRNDEGIALLDRALSLPVDEVLLAQVHAVKGDILFAMSRCSDAISEFEKAEKIYGSRSMQAEKAEILLKKYSANLELGNVDICKAILTDAISIQSKLGDRPVESEARMKLADLLFTTGDTKAARDQYAQALSLARSGKSTADEANCLIGLGMIEYYTGNYKKAESLLTDAQALLKKTDPQLTITDSVYVLNSLGTLSFHQGDYVRSEKLYQEALALSRSGGYSGGEITALESLASLSLQEGKAEKALALLQESLKAAQQGASFSQTAMINASLGAVYESMMRPDEALKCYNASLEINEKTGFRKGIASDYLNLGFFAYSYEGDTDKAEEHYRKALSIYREIKDYYGIITALDLLGSLQKNKGERDKAIALFTEALETAQSQGYLMEEQGMRYRIGYYKIQLGDLKNGFRELEQCVDFYRKGGRNSDLAWMLCSLGGVAITNLGDSAKAEALCREAKALYGQMGSTKGLVECSLLEANILKFRDQYDEARKILQKSLTDAKPYQVVYANCLMALANLNINDLNNIERGSEYLLESIKFCEDYSNINQAAFLLLSSVELCIKLSRDNKAMLKKAEEMLSKAESRAAELKDREMCCRILLMRGRILLERNEPEKAIAFFEKCAADSGNFPIQMVEALLQLKVCHQMLGHDSDAEKAAQKLYELAEKSHFTTLRQKDIILWDLIGYRLSRKDLKGAERLLSEKIEYDTSHNIGMEMGRNYAMAGYINEVQRNRDKALIFYEKSIACADQYLGKAKTEEARLERVNYTSDDIFGGNVHNLSFFAYGGAIRLLLEKGEYAKALDYSERNRARTFVESVGSKAWPPLSKVNEKIMENIKDLREYAGLLASMTREQSDAPLLAMASPPASAVRGSASVREGGEPVNSMEMKRFQAFNGRNGSQAINEIPDQYVEQYKGKYMEILSLLKMENSDYYSLKSNTPAASIAEIQKLLDDDTVIIEYYIDSPGSYLFTITSGAVKAFTIPAGQKEIEARVKALRSAISDNGEREGKADDPAITGPARELYGLLIEPAETAIAGKKRLAIVPHQSLHYLPFTALLNREGKPLVMERSVVYLPSAATLARCRKKSIDEKKEPEPSFTGFALGDEASSGSLGALPGTKEELLKIGQLFKSKKTAIGKDFGIDSIVQDCPEADYLHFATHGVLDEKNPYYSGLAIPGGIFYIANIFDLPSLGRCRMAAISACQTALGKSYGGGNEIVGLSQAFIYAGAPSVASSLWSVSDESTALLMSYFYENLMKGMAKDEALQKAQIRLMERYPQPFHWASFILMGDWEASK